MTGAGSLQGVGFAAPMAGASSGTSSLGVTMLSLSILPLLFRFPMVYPIFLLHSHPLFLTPFSATKKIISFYQELLAFWSVFLFPFFGQISLFYRVSPAFVVCFLPFSIVFIPFPLVVFLYIVFLHFNTFSSFPVFPRFLQNKYSRFYRVFLHVSPVFLFYNICCKKAECRKSSQKGGNLQ